MAFVCDVGSLNLPYRSLGRGLFSEAIDAEGDRIRERVGQSKADQKARGPLSRRQASVRVRAGRRVRRRRAATGRNPRNARAAGRERPAQGHCHRDEGEGLSAFAGRRNAACG